MTRFMTKIRLTGMSRPVKIAHISKCFGVGGRERANASREKKNSQKEQFKPRSKSILLKYFSIF